MAQRKITNLKRKETAVERLTALVAEADAAQTVADRKRQKKFAGMLKAYNAGMTYDEIAEVVGVSKIRVSQVLAEQRGNA